MPPTQRVISRLYLAIMALVTLVVTLVVSLIVSIAIANNETKCINDALGDRSTLTAKDDASQLHYYDTVARASSLAEVRAQAARRASDFRAVAAVRSAHPLGHC